MHKNCCFRHGALSSSKWVFFPISYGGPSNMSIELGAQLNVGMQQSEAFKLHLSIRNQGYWPNILYIGWLVGCIKKEAKVVFDILDDILIKVETVELHVSSFDRKLHLWGTSGEDVQWLPGQKEVGRWSKNVYFLSTFRVENVHVGDHSD